MPEEPLVVRDRDQREELHVRMFTNCLLILGRTGPRVGRQAQVMAMPICNVDHIMAAEYLTEDRVSFCFFFFFFSCRHPRRVDSLLRYHLQFTSTSGGFHIMVIRTMLATHTLCSPSISANSFVRHNGEVPGTRVGLTKRRGGKFPKDSASCFSASASATRQGQE